MKRSKYRKKRGIGSMIASAALNYGIAHLAARNQGRAAPTGLMFVGALLGAPVAYKVIGSPSPTKGNALPLLGVGLISSYGAAYALGKQS
jgi:hypothetical protein